MKWMFREGEYEYHDLHQPLDGDFGTWKVCAEPRLKDYVKYYFHKVTIRNVCDRQDSLIIYVLYDTDKKVYLIRHNKGAKKGSITIYGHQMILIGRELYVI